MGTSGISGQTPIGSSPQEIAVRASGKLVHYRISPQRGPELNAVIPQNKIYDSNRAVNFLATLPTANWKEEHPSLSSEIDKTKKWIEG